MSGRDFIRAGMLALCLGGPALADDRDVLTAFLEDNLSGAGRVVTITGFQGALSSQARIGQMTIADDQGVWLTLKGVTLDWNRAALLGGTLDVQKLLADEIDLERLPDAAPKAALPAAEASAFALPDLPVAVNLGQIAAQRVHLGPLVLGQAVEGRIAADASLSGGQGHIRLTLDRTAGPAGHLALTAVYANATNELTLAVEAKEDAGGLAAQALGIPGAPSVSLILGGRGPLDAFAASLKLDTDGVTRLAGQFATDGTLVGATGFTADLAGDMAPLFAPDYAAFFGNSVSLHTRGRRTLDGAVAVDVLSLKARALTLQGRVNIAADGLPDRLALTGNLAAPDGRPVLLPLTGTETRLASARLTLDYDRTQGEGWTGQIAAQDLDRADLAVKSLVLQAQGHIRHGTEAGLDADLTFDATGLNPSDPTLAKALGSGVTGSAGLAWASGSGKLALSDLNLAAGEGLTLATSGTIGGLETGFQLDGGLTLHARDLSRLADLTGRPTLAGAADLDLTGWISPLSGQFDADVTLHSQALQTGFGPADGFLKGSAQAKLVGSRDETGTRLRRLTLQAGGLDADLSGQVTSQGATLTGRITLDSLAPAGLGLSGGLQAQADFSGTLEDGRLRLTGTGQDLAMGQAQADALGRGKTDIDLDLHLAGPRIDIAQAEITGDALRVSAAGVYDPAAVALDANIHLPQAGAILTGWSGSLDAQTRISGPLTDLAAEVAATSQGLGLGQPMVDRLIGGAGKLSARLGRKDLRLRIDALDFETNAAKITASGPPEDLQVQARLANLGLILPQFPGALTAVGSVKQSEAGTALDLALRGPGQIDARLAGTLSPDLSRAALTAKGTAQAGLANLLIAPRVVSGRASFDLALNGPLALASLTGRASLSQGSLADPDQPVSLQALSAEARLLGGTAQVDAQGNLATGGRVAVTGNIGLTPPLPADLAITLTGAVLRDPNLYTTRLDGDLRFQGPALGGARITGAIDLAETELRIPSTGISSLPVLDDLHHAGDPAEVRATRRRAGLEGASARGGGGGGGYGLDIRVRAPNQVFIRGRGLDAELGGQVRLMGTTAAIVPQGALTLIRGRLDLLGKRLTLSEASLQLQGALIPYVQIAAATQSDGYAIAVRIEGPADAPVVTFTATPALPQEEVLAELLFGKTLQNLSPFQAAQLASAVATLAGRGGEGVIGKLRKSAGLDNLDVQSDVTGKTSVTAGKYLTRNVYTEVTVDQTGKSTVNLNLDVTPHVVLRGHVDDTGQTGIGLYLERDY